MKISQSTFNKIHRQYNVKKLSQMTIARNLGVSQSTVSRVLQSNTYSNYTKKPSVGKSASVKSKLKNEKEEKRTFFQRVLNFFSK